MSQAHNAFSSDPATIVVELPGVGCVAVDFHRDHIDAVEMRADALYVFGVPSGETADRVAEYDSRSHRWLW